jgi:sugar/nucleoside kinase (ribokinase family)
MTNDTQRCVVVGHATIDEIWNWGAAEASVMFAGASVYAACGALAAGGQVVLVTAIGADYDFGPLTDSVERVGGDLEIVAERHGDERSIRNRCWYDGPDDRRWEVMNWTTMLEMSPNWQMIAPVLNERSALVVCPTPVPVETDIVRNARNRCRALVFDTEVHYLSDLQKCMSLLQAASGDVFFAPSWVHLGVLFDSGSTGDAPTDISSLVARCETIGLSQLVVKRGELGSVVLDIAHRRWVEVPAVDGVRVVDPTGAGDAFDGGFAVALARSGDPVEAACWGSVTASFAVEDHGGIVSPGFSRKLAFARLHAVRESLVYEKTADCKSDLKADLAGTPKTIGTSNVPS